MQPHDRSSLPAAITPELLAEATNALEPRKRGRPPKNPPILCKCGCGDTLPRFDAYHRARKYIKGHNRRGAKVAKRAQAPESHEAEPLEGQRPAELAELAEVAARWDCGRATDDELRAAARRIG